MISDFEFLAAYMDGVSTGAILVIFIVLFLFLNKS